MGGLSVVSPGWHAPKDRSPGGRAGQGGEPDRNALAAAHLGLTVAIAWQFARPGIVETDDLAQVGALALIDAAGAFRASCGIPFGAFAAICIRRRCRRLARRAVERAGHQAEFDDLPDARHSPAGHDLERDEDLEGLRCGLAKLDTRLGLIVAMHYGLDGHEPVSFRTIGIKLGLSGEGVRKLHGRAIEELRSHSVA